MTRRLAEIRCFGARLLFPSQRKPAWPYPAREIIKSALCYLGICAFTQQRERLPAPICTITLTTARGVRCLRAKGFPVCATILKAYAMRLHLLFALCQ